ncbi:phage protease [Pseudomonas resinovorans]|uniref:Phage protease n=1 Tax=Metapseudomonas resinovorans TaxID=53412 RepID=A0ABT4Y414_METRE|nr:phage protease [Pseudomonas resinovorans]MDA8483600.1 phage protease [Pseudomonas resinovorans]
MKTQTRPVIAAIAACTFELQAVDAAIQLLPAGAFAARDGRPHDVPSRHWVIDAASAAQLMASAAARVTDLVVDYEHQTLNSAKNGLPAPAAGWIKGAELEWREGVGLFATAPKWTANAAAYIAADEYRYISPVFTYDPRTGAVLQLLHVALTNDPALDGMASLPALAAARFELADSATPSAKETPRVNREQLIALLGLSADASDEDIQSALTNLKGSQEKVQELTTQLAAAKANPDPAQFAPLSVVEGLKQDIVALKSGQVDRDVDELVQVGLSDGRLLPAQEEWARDLGKNNVAALKAYLKTTPAIAALKQRQTGALPAAPEKVEELSPEAMAVCKQMNVRPEDYLDTLKGEAQ